MRWGLSAADEEAAELPQQGEEAGVGAEGEAVGAETAERTGVERSPAAEADDLCDASYYVFACDHFTFIAIITSHYIFVTGSTYISTCTVATCRDLCRNIRRKTGPAGIITSGIGRDRSRPYMG